MKENLIASILISLLTWLVSPASRAHCKTGVVALGVEYGYLRQAAFAQRDAGVSDGLLNMQELRPSRIRQLPSEKIICTFEPEESWGSPLVDAMGASGGNHPVTPGAMAILVREAFWATPFFLDTCVNDIFKRHVPLSEIDTIKVDRIHEGWFAIVLRVEVKLETEEKPRYFIINASRFADNLEASVLLREFNYLRTDNLSDPSRFVRPIARTGVQARAGDKVLPVIFTAYEYVEGIAEVNYIYLTFDKFGLLYNLSDFSRPPAEATSVDGRLAPEEEWLNFIEEKTAATTISYDETQETMGIFISQSGDVNVRCYAPGASPGRCAVISEKFRLGGVAPSVFISYIFSQLEMVDLVVMDMQYARGIKDVYTEAVRSNKGLADKAFEPLEGIPLTMANLMRGKTRSEEQVNFYSGIGIEGKVGADHFIIVDSPAAAGATAEFVARMYPQSDREFDAVLRGFINGMLQKYGAEEGRKKAIDYLILAAEDNSEISAALNIIHFIIEDVAKELPGLNAIARGAAGIAATLSSCPVIISELRITAEGPQRTTISTKVRDFPEAFWKLKEILDKKFPGMVMKLADITINGIASNMLLEQPLAPGDIVSITSIDPALLEKREAKVQALAQTQILRPVAVGERKKAPSLEFQLTIL